MIEIDGEFFKTPFEEFREEKRKEALKLWVEAAGKTAEAYVLQVQSMLIASEPFPTGRKGEECFIVGDGPRDQIIILPDNIEVIS